MSGARLSLAGHSGAARAVDLFSYLTAEGAELAADSANRWIKGLRHAVVDGEPLRRRFTFRGDSLWWFAELYLHKQQAILGIFRTLAALEALTEQEQPRVIGVLEGSAIVRSIAPQFAATQGIRCGDPAPRRWSLAGLAAMEARAGMLHGSALVSRLRRRPVPAPGTRGAILAFVHRAFWRPAVEDGSAEQYIGPVLQALDARLPAGGLHYVSLGPAANFAARRWWHPVMGSGDLPAAPSIEVFATLDRLRPSRRLWRRRHELRRALWGSRDPRAASRIRGCDCWGIVREQLAGIALLQWPWSARAMDEAAGTLDAFAPAAAVTYAEAGGWGRAIILECRRRGIPTGGLQHGFIHRHWLNYLHEEDEMAADPLAAADAGFPRPSLTLLFDGYAQQHLLSAGRFPAASLRITGSPRLDDLVGKIRALSTEELAQARAGAGAGPADALVLVATKWKEAADVLPGLLRSLVATPRVHLVIKTHPAETPDAYDAAVRGLSHVRVLPASAPLAPLLAASRAVVTLNSTVALDAAVVGVPALVAGLPNNLSPFVEAGLMVGTSPAEAAAALGRILYDQGFRQQLEAVRQTFLARFQIRSDGQAAERTASEVLRLAHGAGPAPGSERGECD